MRGWSRLGASYLVRVACLLTLAATRTLAAQPCELPVRNSDNPNAYKLRGDRCEGLYIQEVAISPLTVVSLTERRNALQHGHEDLRLGWYAPGNAQVRVRAVSLSADLYYRMDTLRSAQEGAEYYWPGDLRSALGISIEELGIIATTSPSAVKEYSELYLPVRLNADAKHLQQPLQILLKADEHITNATVSVWFVSNDKTFAVATKPSHKTSAPAGYPLRVELPALTRHGLYKVEIGVALSAGGGSTSRIWIYLPPEALETNQ